jgi:hypothetical protein
MFEVLPRSLYSLMLLPHMHAQAATCRFHPIPDKKANNKTLFLPYLNNKTILVARQDNTHTSTLLPYCSFVFYSSLSICFSSNILSLRDIFICFLIILNL